MKLVESLRPAAAEPPDDPSQLVLSYLSLRRCVGLVGLALPVVLYGSHFLGLVPGPLPDSMSAFYYTRMAPYFIGTLCALGVFLFSYRYARSDNRLSNIASVFVTFVALCPTAPAGSPSTLWNHLHLVAAAGFFLIVAVFSGFMFTRKPGQSSWWARWATPWPTTTAEDRRDWVYRLCALIIIGSLVAAGLAGARGSDALFWGETAAVLAFSFSWLVKGQFRWLWHWVVFPDPPTNG